MTETPLFLQLTGELPLFKVLDFLIENKGMDFTKSDIARGADISRTSLFHYWPSLERYGIVRMTRQFGKTKLYTLNGASPVTKKLLDLEKALIAHALDSAQEVVLEH